MLSDPTPGDARRASPEDLVVRLSEAAARLGREARGSAAAGGRAGAGRALPPVRAIVRELDRALGDGAGSLGRHLAAVHEYALGRLEEPGVGLAAVDEAAGDVEALCEAWSALVGRLPGRADPDGGAPHAAAAGRG